MPPTGGRLRERLARRRAAREEADGLTQLAVAYAQVLDRLAEAEEAAEGPEQEVARRLSVYAALAEQFLVTAPARPSTPDPDEAPARDPLAEIRAEAEADRRNNVLYQLWMQQRLTQGPIDLELEEFSEVVAGRALVRLLFAVPRGRELLRGLAPQDHTDWIPDQAAVRRFVASGGLAEPDPQTFLARLFAEVPGARRALYRLLGAYKQVVRLAAERAGEPYPGELPGEDYTPRPVTYDALVRLLGVPPQPEERLAAATARYLAGASLAEAARAYDIPRDRLRAHLVDIGALRAPGRPRTHIPEGANIHAAADRES